MPGQDGVKSRGMLAHGILRNNEAGKLAPAGRLSPSLLLPRGPAEHPPAKKVEVKVEDGLARP
jgi:hypothetical protein